MTSTIPAPMPAGDYWAPPPAFDTGVPPPQPGGVNGWTRYGAISRGPYGQITVDQMTDEEVNAVLADHPESRVSMAAQLGQLDDAAITAWIAQLPDNVVAEVARKEWWFVSRPDQREPAGDWAIWLILAGRGWGKTRTGGEWLIDRVVESPVDVDGHPTEWAAVAPNLQDGRRILVEGPSGLRNILNRRGIRHTYVKSPSPHLVLSTGQKIHVLGAHDQDTGRGYNLAGAWLDEVAKWPYPMESWTEGLAPALRIPTPGNAKPRVVVTTTPKPTPLLFDWTRRKDGSVHITRGSTFDNAANLAPSAVAEFIRLYGNSRVGRQELYAELLTDVEGALWELSWIEDNRLDPARMGFVEPELDLKVCSVDPAVSVTETSDETGIVVVGRGVDGYEYVLGDRSGKVAGRDAAIRAWRTWRDFNCDILVYEDNQGMDWVRDVLEDQWWQLQRDDLTWPAGDPPLESVNARRGKRLRAEPAAARYSNNRVRHVGVYPVLESQLVEWIPDQGQDSPDRLDALVHGLTRLRAGLSSGVVSAPGATTVNPEPVMGDPDQQRLNDLLNRTLPQPGRINR